MPTSVILTLKYYTNFHLKAIEKLKIKTENKKD